MLNDSGYTRFNNSPNQKLEADQAYTIEPGLAVPGYGYLGLDEDVVMTDKDAEYIGGLQTEMVLINQRMK